MKTTIALLALTISMNVFANATTRHPGEEISYNLDQSSMSSSDLSAISSGRAKEASEALKNVEDYRLSGVMAPKLSQQVADLQKQIDLSNEESLDLIVERAEEILR